MFRKGTHLVSFPIYWVYSTHILCNELTQTLKKWEKNVHTMFLSTKILWPTYPSKANDKGIMLSYLPRRRDDFDNRWNTVYVNRVCFVGTYMLITDIYGIFSLYRSQLSFIFLPLIWNLQGGGVYYSYQKTLWISLVSKSKAFLRRGSPASKISTYLTECMVIVNKLWYQIGKVILFRQLLCFSFFLKKERR